MNIKGHLHIHPIVLLIPLCLYFFTFCVFTPHAFALSIEDEKVLGEKFLAQMRTHFEVVKDDFANEFINDLGEYLITPLETKPFPFHFYFIKDDTLNAFAAPGGNIFIFSGLVEVTESVDELASIICHEIGHVSARHLAQRLEQNKKIGLATMAGILAGVLIGGPAAEALVTGSLAAGIQTQLYYSRNDERQADQLGFKYMKSAAFDPRGMVSILKKIERGNWLGADKPPAYLMTHPTGPERMANLDTLLSGYVREYSRAEAERFRALFSFIKTVLRAKCLDSNEAERQFTLELKKDPNSYLPHFGLGIVYKERAEYALAIHHLNTALEREPASVSVPILTKLGEAYQGNGQDREAILVLERALKFSEGDSSILFLMGLSYENLEEYDKAITLFERLASFKPVKNEVYYRLGISYGKRKMLALAHYNFGVYFKAVGEQEKARFHFRKAEGLSGTDHALKRKIKRITEGPPVR